MRVGESGSESGREMSDEDDVENTIAGHVERTSSLVGALSSDTASFFAGYLLKTDAMHATYCKSVFECGAKQVHGM
jgi:hypothetical protein